MSFAERRGRKEGKVDGKLEVAKRLLQGKVNLAFIKKTTGLSAKKIKELEKKRKEKY